MKITCCDICYKENKIVESGWISKRKGNNGMSFKADICDGHKDFFRDCNSIDECHSKLIKHK